MDNGQFLAGRTANEANDANNALKSPPPFNLKTSVISVLSVVKWPAKYINLLI